MNQTAATLNRIAFAADRDIDRLTNDLAEGVGAAVRKHAEPGPNGKQIITPLARTRILKDVDALLDAAYGTKPGNRSPMYRAISRRVREAYSAPNTAAAEEMRRRLVDEPLLLGILEGRR
jgi:hypothetical protein